LTGTSSLDAPHRDQVLPPVASFIVLYALLYGAFGAASPFLPAFIEERGIPPELIGVLFGAGTAIRLVSAPVAGRIADRTQALRLTLAVCAVGTALAVMSYLPAASFWLLLLVSLLHAAALAPTTNLADALALVASRRGRPVGFEYGWVRGAGSATFIVASIIAGWAIASHGLSVVIWLQALLMLAVPFAAARVPPVDAKAETAAVTRAGIAALLRLPVFRRVVLVAALILGSHAMHDTFSVIRWRAAGISPQAISVLWSLSVAAEVVVFFVLGPWLLRKLTPAGAVALAAMAGAARWLVADSAAPRRDLCPAASRLHAHAGAERSGRPCRHGSGHLRHGRRRRGDCPPYACLRMALCPPGSGSLWHHECAVPRGLADRALIETGARCHIPLTRPASR
jgi:PPP family 3-phenylpropionic acid transporter